MINLNNPSRILLVGDTHANLYWWLDDVLPMAKKQKTSVILQLGDFGIWSGKQGEGYLDRLEKELELANRWLYFIDGNHARFSLFIFFSNRRDRSSLYKGKNSPPSQRFPLGLVRKEFSCLWRSGEY